MIFKIILITIVVILGLIVVLPFVLNLAGFNILQFGSVGGGVNVYREGLLRSQDGGETWENVAATSDKQSPLPTEILDFSFHSTSSDTIFIGAKASGLWKSSDGGSSWQRVLDKARVLDQRADVYKVAVSRSKPEIIYLAVFQNNRGRVLKSWDGGETFREVYFTSADRYQVFGIFVSPSDPNRVVIATGQGGVLESKNGGTTWRVKRWFSEALIGLLVNPVFPDEIFVVTSSGKIFKTFDGGKNWADLNEFLSRAEEAGRQSYSAPRFSFNPFQGLGGIGSSFVTLIDDPQIFTTLYLGSGTGLFRSLTGGFFWERLNVLVPPEALPVSSVAVHPKNSSVVFASAANQVHKSVDGGVNWSVKTLSVDGRIKKLLIDPLKPEVIFIVPGK